MLKFKYLFTSVAINRLVHCNFDNGKIKRTQMRSKDLYFSKR